MLICLRFSTIQQIAIILFGIRYKYKYIACLFVGIHTFMCEHQENVDKKCQKTFYKNKTNREHFRLRSSECGSVLNWIYLCRFFSHFLCRSIPFTLPLVVAHHQNSMLCKMRNNLNEENQRNETRQNFIDSKPK